MAEGRLPVYIYLNESVDLTGFFASSFFGACPTLIVSKMSVAASMNSVL